MVIRNEKGEVVKVYTCGSEEQLRYEQALEIFLEIKRKQIENFLNKKKEEKGQIEQIIDQPDKKIIRRVRKKRAKRYNLSQTAKIVGVSRQALYYWIKRG